jgi:hypothetical protein
VGTAVTTVGMFLLSTLGTESSRFESALYMAICGIGVGLVMQIVILAVQNESPVEDLGVSTATVNFFRSVGGSVGVAAFGALFASRLTALLGPAANLKLTPEMVQKLPPAERAATAAAFADSITHIFLYAVPLMFVAFVLVWFLKETPLRTTSGDARRALELDLAEESLGMFGDPALVLDESLEDGIEMSTTHGAANGNANGGRAARVDDGRTGAPDRGRSPAASEERER